MLPLPRYLPCYSEQGRGFSPFFLHPTTERMAYMRRMMMLMTVVALMMAMMAMSIAPAFAAQKPAPGCTFAKGTTTCVETVLLESTIVRVKQPGTVYCSSTGGYVPTYLDYRRDTFGETTTTYKAKSDTVTNTAYRVYQTDTLIGVSNDCGLPTG